jgi:hypothetical protein
MLTKFKKKKNYYLFRFLPKPRKTELRGKAITKEGLRSASCVIVPSTAVSSKPYGTSHHVVPATGLH